jgi:hypothetical protein
MKMERCSMVQSAIAKPARGSATNTARLIVEGDSSMQVPKAISDAYALLDANQAEEAEQAFQVFLDSYSSEDEVRARALTGLALVHRRREDHRRVLEFAIASVKASGPTLNNSWGLLQEASRKVYPDAELTHGTCDICQTELVCPPDFESQSIRCPHHEGVKITWQGGSSDPFSKRAAKASDEFIEGVKSGQVSVSFSEMGSLREIGGHIASGIYGGEKVIKGSDQLFAAAFDNLGVDLDVSNGRGLLQAAYYIVNESAKRRADPTEFFRKTSRKCLKELEQFLDQQKGADQSADLAVRAAMGQAESIKDMHRGNVSVTPTELLSFLEKMDSVPHLVLNGKRVDNVGGLFAIAFDDLAIELTPESSQGYCIFLTAYSLAVGSGKSGITPKELVARECAKRLTELQERMTDDSVAGTTMVREAESRSEVVKSIQAGGPVTFRDMLALFES